MIAEIEQMVADAEKYADEDAKVAERVAAKNGLESYAYSLKQTLDNGELKDKFQGEDHATLESKVKEVISFLDSADSASKEELEGEQKSLEEVANPIMQRFYQAGGQAEGAAGGAPGGFPGAGGAPNAGGAEPSVEEVD